ncbi:hypothetical protein GQX74_003252 [Glossina fuscipes]|nr:hypothetical protein GQX74_003252 [Glossina fuscipes]
MFENWYDTHVAFYFVFAENCIGELCCFDHLHSTLRSNYHLKSHLNNFSVNILECFSQNLNIMRMIILIIVSKGTLHNNHSSNLHRNFLKTKTIVCITERSTVSVTKTSYT